MKKRIILPIMLTIGLLAIFTTACKKDKQTKTYSVSGKAQKGPFVTGANITINELNENLEQTGKSFTSSISSDDGSFSLNSVELESEIALITVNGYYYDETANYVPTGTLNLQALVDISGKSTINVNAMTHVLKDRVEVLFKSGLPFDVANKIAKDELLLSMFGIMGTTVRDFDQLDLVNSGDENAVLLAFSVMMLREYYSFGYAAILTELLTKMRTDFKDNGEINNPDLINQIWDNVRFLNPIVAKQNLSTRYQQMGQNVTLPDMQKYINKFVEKHAQTIYEDYYYPEFAPIASYGGNVTDHRNILDKTTTEISNQALLTFAVITPLNKSLTVKLKPMQGNLFNMNSPCFLSLIDLKNGGWYIEKHAEDEVIITSARQNLLVSYEFCRFVPLQQPFTIEYYENNSQTPTFTKTVTFTN